MTQDNLGDAFERLGERGSATAPMEAAIRAFTLAATGRDLEWQYRFARRRERGKGGTSVRGKIRVVHEQHHAQPRQSSREISPSKPGNYEP
jgi:hypothetical protein